jgi:hypothetical protein
MYPATYRRKARYRARGGLSPLGAAALAVVAVGVVAACSAVFGGDETPSGRGTPAALPVERDVKLALKARRVLQEDEDFKDLNLGVRVLGSVIVLWGPVPSADAERKAVRLLRTVPGVREVRSEAYLAADKKVEPIRVPAETAPPTKTQSASPGEPPAPGGQLTGRTPVLVLPPSGRAGAAGPAEPKEAPAPAPVTLGPPVTLLAPVLTPAPQAANPPPAADSLVAAVERLRQGNERFRQVRVEVEGSAVFVLSGSAPAEHVMAFARALSALSGVERVVIRSGSR